jgi:hypothetical protein
MKLSLKVGRVSSILAVAILAGTLQVQRTDAASHPSVAAAGGPGKLPLGALKAQGVPSTGQYATGDVPSPRSAASLRRPLMTMTSVPTAVDLSQWDPPVGSQGGVQSCSAWSTGYYLRGWYAKRDGYYPGSDAAGTGSFSPMYTYSQLVNGQNTGTKITDNLNIQQSQGIDTRSDYWQGTGNFTQSPSQAETVNADQYRLFSYWDMTSSSYPGGWQGWIQSFIEQTLASGNPVVIAFPVYANFKNLNSTSYYYSSTLGKILGNHAVFALAYDGNGLWIENSWGTGWGNSGYAELSWSFVKQYVFEVAGIVPTPMTHRFQGTPAGSLPYLYVLDSSRNLWFEAGSASHRTWIDGNVAAFQAINLGAPYLNPVYVLGTDGKLWRETGSASNRSLIDGNAASFQALDGTTVFVKGTNGKLWRESPNASNRWFVDANVESFQALNTTAVYVLGTDGTLYREVGNAGNSTFGDPDATVAEFQPMDSTWGSGSLYVLGTDGKLWYEPGGYTNRTLINTDV